MDECSTDVCDQNCTNSVGSFMCSCNAGFELDSDGQTCNGQWPIYLVYIIMCIVIIDIDECLMDNGGCNYVCNNEMGTFSCSCTTGYELQPDGITCIGEARAFYTLRSKSLW